MMNVYLKWGPVLPKKTTISSVLNVLCGTSQSFHEKLKNDGYQIYWYSWHAYIIHSRTCIDELSNVFVAKADNGGSRKFPMQSPEIMENNLNQGMFKWKSITDNDGF